MLLDGAYSLFQLAEGGLDVRNHLAEPIFGIQQVFFRRHVTSFGLQFADVELYLPQTVIRTVTASTIRLLPFPTLRVNWDWLVHSSAHFLNRFPKPGSP